MLPYLREVERNRKRNPPLPEWLIDDYKSAWRKLDQRALVTLGKTTDTNFKINVGGTCDSTGRVVGMRLWGSGLYITFPSIPPGTVTFRNRKFLLSEIAE